MLQGGDVLDMVLEYIGFSPSRFYLRECSRALHREVSGVIYLNEADFFEALERRLVNPKFLKLQPSALSDSVISRLSSSDRILNSWAARLELLVEGKSIDDLMMLGEKSLEKILVCSVLRMNIQLFETTLAFIETREYASSAILGALHHIEVQRALMTADALEMLRAMLRNVSLHSDAYLAKDLMVSSIESRATRCSNFLLIACMGLKIPDHMLDAVAHSGDLVSVKAVCRNASTAMIESALYDAVSIRHLKMAEFLRSEWITRQTVVSNDAKMNLIDDLLNAWYGKITNRLVHDETSEEFLNWLFDGIDDLNNARIDGITLLEFACYDRIRTLCHYLVRRGCSSFGLQCGTTGERIELTLEMNDLVHVLDLCCEVKKGVPLEEDPVLELFLLRRGICIAFSGDDENFVMQKLREGFEYSSFANRVDLIKHYLLENPGLASLFSSFCPGQLKNCGCVGMTPLGALELIGTPETRIWDGKNITRVADFLSTDMKTLQLTDEWNLTRPNEVEIQALRDIKAALIQHGADPEVLFECDALTDLPWEKGVVSYEFVKRVIDGRADVNDESNDFKPLTMALMTFQPLEVIKLLLDSGASVESNSSLVAIEHGLKSDQLVAHNNLWTTLSTFAAIRNPDILRLILERKANPNLPERIPTGLTPLSWVLSLNLHGKHDVAKVLLEYRADINATDDCGRTAIFRAIGIDDEEGVDLLIKHGAYLSVPDKREVRPIDIAWARAENRGNETGNETAAGILRKIKEVTGDSTRRFLIDDAQLSIRDLHSNIYYDWNSAERRYAQYEFRRQVH